MIEEKLYSYLLDERAIANSAYTMLENAYWTHKENYILDLGKRYFAADKLFNMILFFANEGVLKTKLMKLLWYSDFLHFKRKEVSISGTPYWHLPYGPVPKYHNLLLGCLNGMDLIDINEEEVDEGYTKMIIFSKQLSKYDIFSPYELKVMNEIKEYFKEYGSRKISEYAHNEDGWKDTVEEQIISYEYARSLSLS